MKISPLQLVLMSTVIFVGPFLPVLISGRWDWWEAWAYALLSVLGFIVSRLLAARRNPDILAERGRSFEHANTKAWDRVLSPLVGLGSSFLPLLAGLEMRIQGERLADVSEFSQPLKLAALLLILAGYVISSAALITNRYFSGVVRIQSERGHHVVSSGPYAWVRHPGYAGSLLVFLALPVWLDSPWSFVLVAVFLAAIVLRTHLEDQTLQAELPGYAAYAQQVRYRLLPGVW